MGGASAGTLLDVALRRAETEPDRLAYAFLGDGENESGRLTCAELDRRCRALAVRLQDVAAPGDRVLLLLPPGLDYVVSFLACLYAGVVAVPAYPPRANGHGLDRLSLIVRDAGAVAALAPSNVREVALTRGVAGNGLSDLRWLTPDEAALTDAAMWRQSDRDPAALAFLQYTSGSTGEPRGVMVGHDNVMANLAIIQESFGNTRESVGVAWLPPYHDMGLVGGLLQPLYAGFPAISMAPGAFLQRPIRWLRQMSLHRATVTIAPNFAYDLCVDRTSPEEREGLDLSSWEVAGNGAEPVRQATLRGFVGAFGPYGFRARAFYPCYGLAETTLLAAGGDRAAAPPIARVDAAALEAGCADPAPSGARERTLVGCGWAWPEHELRIVDPTTRQPAGPDAVGEIWLAGPSVARGYWGKPDETAQTFGACLADGRGPYLRTGDLGVVRDGELYVTGRIKDLLIVNGRNVYPADIEATASASHPTLRRYGAAAFTVGSDAAERLVVVQEVERHALRRVDPDEAIAAVRSALWQAHDLVPNMVVLVKPGGVPLTSSGKVRRAACREELLAGSLPIIARWSAGDGAPAPADAAGRDDAVRAAGEADLRDHVAGLLGVPVEHVDPTLPLSGYAVTSLQVVEFQGYVADRFGVDLELDLFAGDPSVRRLAAYVHEREAARQGRIDLAAEVQLDPSVRASGSAATGPNALLSGATGFLGAYLLRELLADPAAQIHCLVRAPSEEVARERIERNLVRYGLWDPAQSSRIVPVLGDLTQPRLGLDERAFGDLAERIDVIYHNAAWLNFLYAYPLLKAANVGGTHEVLRLAAHGRTKPVHYVSTTGVFDSTGYALRRVDETTPLDQPGGMVLGYSQSKWVAERVVALARDRGLPIAVYRPSWIFGDAESGLCNVDDFISRLLDACVQLGIAPEMDFVWNVVSVDYVARAIAYLSRQPDAIGATFHLSSTRPVHWSEMVEWLRASGHPIRAVSYETWRDRMAERDGRPPTALDPLIPLLTAADGPTLTVPRAYVRTSMPTIDCAATVERLGAAVASRPFDSELFARHLRALRRAGLLAADERELALR